MVTWGELRSSRPDLADLGRHLLYQFGVGLAFLATVGRDGAPRVHPFCPLLTEADLFAFLVPSPKRDDLLRDGRYAMHSFPCPDNEDAFYLAGRGNRLKTTPCAAHGRTSSSTNAAISGSRWTTLPVSSSSDST